MSTRLEALTAAGVSIWLDDLSRERIETGSLADLVKNRSVVGVTTNPTIFAAAIADGERYDEQTRRLVAAGAGLDRVIFELTTEDVRNACDILADTFAATDGVDGRVSIEVAPTLAFDTEGTLTAARDLWRAVDRPNLFVKIPGTTEGLPAVTAALSEGISVNVTLIFGLHRYDQVMDAYLAGVEQARDAGRDLARLQSVASFFVSRVDTEVDKRLDAVGTAEAKELKGKAAVANARLAYQAYERKFSGARFAALERAGAARQRPLWASTGVKNPDYPDTMYVDQLVVADTVNTMPEKTLEAVADHGDIGGDVGGDTGGDTVTSRYDDARLVLDALAGQGVDYDDVIATLEREGVDKFVTSWEELQETVEGQMEAVRT